MEPRYFEDPGTTIYGQWLRDLLKKMPFPNDLVPVPDPIDNIFVRTGEPTPFSGIWEPVDGPKQSLISLLTKVAKPQPPFKIAGAMNYLHGGSNAPKISVETTDDNLDLDTTWRLLWKDDRYEDGTVPKEEASYLFTKPDQVRPSTQAIAMLNETIWGHSGSIAPVGGKWLVEADLSASVILQKGERLPMHEGRDVRWVHAEHQC
jgi:hypothetical protein